MEMSFSLLNFFSTRMQHNQKQFSRVIQSFIFISFVHCPFYSLNVQLIYFTSKQTATLSTHHVFEHNETNRKFEIILITWNFLCSTATSPRCSFLHFPFSTQRSTLWAVFCFSFFARSSNHQFPFHCFSHFFFDFSIAPFDARIKVKIYVGKHNKNHQSKILLICWWWSHAITCIERWRKLSTLKFWILIRVETLFDAGWLLSRALSFFRSL